MDISLRSLLLAGIGTMAYTVEKGSEIVDELVKKGELTVSQGRQLADELKRNMGNKGPNPAADADRISAAVSEAILRMNLATRQDIDLLSQRISNLESRM